MQAADIFLNTGNCGSCHLLKDAGTVGNIGPNLNQIRPDINRVIVAVTNGIGVMPAYQGELTLEEIEAVAHYVSISAENLSMGMYSGYLIVETNEGDITIP